MKILFRIYSKLVRICKSYYLSSYISNDHPLLAINVCNSSLKIVICKGLNARFILNGKLKISSWQGGNEPVLISLGENSKLIIDGDFEIGNGTQIILDKGASLYIGGRRNESASGITERTRILVRKQVHIGFDCIFAWDVFITDCDWHTIENKENQGDVSIGNHVWTAHKCSILKGSRIGNGCIIAAHAVMTGQILPDNCMGGGNPFHILAENLVWHRDLS
jgi:hypothetical protein